MSRRDSFRVEALIEGAVAGALGTLIMDVVTTGVQRMQSAADAEREAAARPRGQSSVTNLVDRVSEGLGIRLDQLSRELAASATHYALGIIPGAAYAVVRDRFLPVRAGRGILFGLALWVVNDELLNSALGLSGPPEAYPLSSHMRGLIGHVVLGVATDLGIELADRLRM